LSFLFWIPGCYFTSLWGNASYIIPLFYARGLLFFFFFFFSFFYQDWTFIIFLFSSFLFFMHLASVYYRRSKEGERNVYLGTLFSFVIINDAEGSHTQAGVERGYSLQE